MVSIKIYTEGAGRGKALDITFRKAWRQFFEAAGMKGRLPSTIPCGDRHGAYQDFCKAIRHINDSDMPLLLVDSEDAVAKNDTVWQHLAKHNMAQPANATNDHAYLMAQVMETWILADADAVKTYFKNDFNATKIPAWPNLEAVPKATIFDTLEKCTSGKYQKGKVSFDILATLDPNKVAEKCPHAKDLLDFLKKER